MSQETPLWMDQDLTIFRDSARKIFEQEFAPREMDWIRQGHSDRSVWNELGAHGLLCASIPVEYGGAGGSFAYDAVICAEQARAQVGSFSLNVHSAIVAHYILNHGTEAQKLRWLPRMASGEMVAAIAMSEPGAGSDLQAIRTSARRDGDSYVINGAKTFITNGLHADLVCVVARTNPAIPGAKGLSLLMVETADCAGFRRGRLLEKIGQRGQDTAELFFDEVRTPAAYLLGGEEGRGFVQLMKELPRERLLIAIGATAMMERAVADTYDYADQRKVFGQRLMDLQNTRFKLAECHTKAAVARRFVDDCIQRALAGTLDVPTASMAKWWVTETNCQVIDECLQLHGGYGYMMEYPIARLYTDARVGRIYGGANEIMKELVARSLEQPR
ncbi:acyl-CoA dehydrogenase family protein [Isoalcanivorax beigongshangi]|uniref:Acyl-[acyl-carrier-protein] dehydrogenase MbtN n=1 Tax=Isoalcanivorax beigongshangi TaxID=3238810 RepID=A0ABV4AI78_9GAMM